MITTTEEIWLKDRRLRVATLYDQRGVYTVCLLWGLLEGSDPATIVAQWQHSPTALSASLSFLNNERWHRNLTKDVARGLIAAWRARCVANKFTKAYPTGGLM